jgi:hypothetical protein
VAVQKTCYNHLSSGFRDEFFCANSPLCKFVVQKISQRTTPYYQGEQLKRDRAPRRSDGARLNSFYSQAIIEAASRKPTQVSALKRAFQRAAQTGCQREQSRRHEVRSLFVFFQCREDHTHNPRALRRSVVCCDRDHARPSSAGRLMPVCFRRGPGRHPTGPDVTCCLRQT